MDEKTLKQVQEVLHAQLEEHSEGMKGTINELVTQRVDDELKKHNITRDELMKGKLPYGFHDQGSEVNATKYQKIGSFIKNVFKRDVESLTKAMTEGQDSQGGFVVPEEFYSEVQRISQDYGLISKFAAKFGMKSDTLNVPTEATSVSVYWPGEATNGTESSPVLSNAPLAAKTLMGITIASNEYLEDANIDNTKYLMGLFAEAFAGEIDNQGFNGTGSPFVGILANSNVTTVTMASGQDTFAETTLGDLRDLISQVTVSVLPSSAFFMNKAVWGIVQKLQEGSQTVAAFQNQLINVGKDGKDISPLQPHGYLWGYPVYLTDKITGTTAVSTEFVVFGSLSKGYFLGDRKQMTMDLSKEATIGSTNLFQSNQSAVRLTQRLAGKVGLAGAFATLKTAAS